MSTNLPHVHSVWRQDELRHINETTAGPERKAALCALLEQEAQLIASIGRHKITAGQKNKEEATRRFLDMVNRSLYIPELLYNCSFPGLHGLWWKFEVISCILLPPCPHTHPYPHPYPHAHLSRWQLQSGGLHTMGRQQQWTHPSHCVPNSCVTSTTVSR